MYKKPAKMSFQVSTTFMAQTYVIDAIFPSAVTSYLSADSCQTTAFPPPVISAHGEL